MKLRLRLPFFTRDEAPLIAMDDMRIITDEKIGPKQSITREGFLLCEDVAIARTGLMLYAHGETPVPVGKDGVTKIQRLAEDVFKSEFVQSFAGKPVTNDHPLSPVDPIAWRDVAIGTVLNPRRGTGADDNCIVADLLIYDADAIKEVRDGKRSISAGYSAHYDELAPGIGKQYDMFANHVALVAIGRCGAQCSIRDHGTAHHTGDSSMKKGPIKSLLEAVREALKTKDETKINTALDAATAAATAADEAPHMTDEQVRAEISASEGRITTALTAAITGLESKFKPTMDSVAEAVAARTARQTTDTVEAAARKVLEEGLRNEGIKDADKVVLVTDSGALTELFQATVSAAEILMPGVQVPVFDAKAAPKATFDSICAFRKTALGLAYATNEGRATIDSVHGKALELDKLSCEQVGALFRSAATVKKTANNAAVRAADRTRIEDKTKKPGLVRTVADLNLLFKDHYGKKQATAQ